MKKLRRKIVFGVLLSAFVVFLLTIFIYGLMMNSQITRRADSITGLIDRYNGNFPPPKEYEKLDQSEQIRLYNYDEESPYRLRFFIVYTDSEGNMSADTDHIAAVDKDTAISMASGVINVGEECGYYNDYRFRVSESDASVIFLDVSDDLDSLWILLGALSLIAVFFMLMITVVFFFLSRRIVRPFEENSRM